LRMARPQMTMVTAEMSMTATGVRGMMQITPSRTIRVVTMLEVAMAMVEMTSPSSELALTPFCYSAFRAQGIFRLEMLPVTKLR
jgi:hypothetical protein